MPGIDSGNPSSPPVRPPTCPDCGVVMRLESASRDGRYINIKHMIYGCDCGRTSDQMIAVPE
jgi:hypothetical protein